MFTKAGLPPESNTQSVTMFNERGGTMKEITRICLVQVTTVRKVSDDDAEFLTRFWMGKNASPRTDPDACARIVSTADDVQMTTKMFVREVD